MTKKEKQAKAAAAGLFALYFKNLDNIYNTCEEIAKHNGKDYIDLAVLKGVINVVKLGIKKDINE